MELFVNLWMLLLVLNIKQNHLDRIFSCIIFSSTPFSIIYLYSQPFYCIACAVAWSTSTPNWRTPFSMLWPFHASLLASWPSSTHTIWPSLHRQTSIPCIRGWAWSPWDYSCYNLFSDFSRMYSIRATTQHKLLSWWKMCVCAWQTKNNANFLISLHRFLVCLCCENATSGCRGAMVPIHASIGLATFMLAIATSISGLTQRAIYTLGWGYLECLTRLAKSLPSQSIEYLVCFNFQLEIYGMDRRRYRYQCSRRCSRCIGDSRLILHSALECTNHRQSLCHRTHLNWIDGASSAGGRCVRWGPIYSTYSKSTILSTHNYTNADIYRNHFQHKQTNPYYQDFFTYL